MHKSLLTGSVGWLAPNDTPMETKGSIERSTAAMISVASLFGGPQEKETASSYATPLTGTQPPGVGFNFGDTWRRTQHGTMEFQLPVEQNEVINQALRFAFENVFVGKSLRVKTNFTCKGLQNSSASNDANDFFDDIVQKHRLQDMYRQAVWLYYSVGLVPIVISEPDKPLTYCEILDPRMVKVQKAFGKTFLYLKPDQRMIAAVQDPKGDKNPLNGDYFRSMPKSWVRQIQEAYRKGQLNDMLIKLDDGTYTVIENFYNPVTAGQGRWDGCPLQPYFSALMQYRMLMAGDFASAFLAKNLIALVSVGDPQHEGDRYVRPDQQTLANLQAAFQNPNSAQWAYVDPTVNLRYITPDPKVFSSDKYKAVEDQIKNLLPAPFWYNDGQGAYAAAQTQMTELQEEVAQCNDTFDRNFWQIIYERAALGKSNIARKHIKPPKHDRHSLKPAAEHLENMGKLYANGGLSIRSLMEEHGMDFDVEKARLEAQKDDVKKGTYMPAFEQKQGIVAQKTYGIQTKGSGKDGKSGRPAKSGSKPQAESTSGKQPRPSTGN